MLKNNLKKFVAALAAAGMLLSGCAGAAGESSQASSAAAQSSTSQSSTSQSSEASKSASTSSTENTSDTDNELITDEDAPEIEGLTYDGSIPLEYAEKFKIHYYNDDYKLIEVVDDADYLIVPEGAEAPDGLDSDIQVLYQPLQNIYLAATSAMALFNSIDGLSSIKFSGTKADGWYVDAAKKAMESGDIVYAGKYSEPDYELLLDNNCDAAIESTMILHAPKVQEMLETLGIPVFTDRSSYETEPLGRVEWVKAYAAMLNKEDEADKFFATKSKVMDEAAEYEKTDLKVAFFYIDSTGTVVIRRDTDYIPKMIEIAGADYVYDDSLEGSEGSINVNVTMEQFYNIAIDADYLIYNASIDKQPESIDDLLAKSELLADFKAVKEGNVYTTGKSFYQATDRITDFITDVHGMITGDTGNLQFISKVE